ncbi:MAG: response regulator transcription factor [Candidatus Kerfeldbacteria bacterium]
MADKKYKILIAEDEKPMAKALTYKFNNNGFIAKSVFNGQEALHELKKEEYDLLILDLMMPVMDGFTLLGELKNNNINTPVIVASNLGQENDINEAKKLGAVDYIIKADTPLLEIIEKVNKVLKKVE